MLPKGDVWKYLSLMKRRLLPCPQKNKSGPHRHPLVLQVYVNTGLFPQLPWVRVNLTTLYHGNLLSLSIKTKTKLISLVGARNNNNKKIPQTLALTNLLGERSDIFHYSPEDSLISLELSHHCELTGRSLCIIFILESGAYHSLGKGWN